MQRIGNKWITGLVGLLVIFLSLGWFASRIVTWQIASGISKHCESCILKAESTHFSLRPTSLVLSSVTFHSGNAAWTAFDAQAQQLVIPFSFLSFFKKEAKLGLIHFQGLYVTITEGGVKTPPSPVNDEEEESAWRYAIQGVSIAQGKFEYARTYGATTARLHVANITGSMGPVGTTPELKDQIAHAEATGSLEESGSFLLTIDSAIFSKILNAKIGLQLNNQNLGDISPFFETSGQIKINGDLIDGKSDVEIQDKKLVAWVRARYKNLAIKFSKGKDRSAMVAFFSNLIQAFKLRSSDLKSRPDNQIRTVKLERKKDETIVLFVLHGMKDAALGVATDN